MKYTITFWNDPNKKVKIEGETFKDAFELAVRTKTDFSYAELNYAELNYAKLNDAKLNGAKLNGAKLNDAELNDGTDMDYSSFPLWCGSFRVKATLRLAAQLAYHFCRIDFSKCPEAKALQQLPEMKALANKFHRVDECGGI